MFFFCSFHVCMAKLAQVQCTEISTVIRETIILLLIVTTTICDFYNLIPFQIVQKDSSPVCT